MSLFSKPFILDLNTIAKYQTCLFKGYENEIPPMVLILDGNSGYAMYMCR